MKLKSNYKTKATMILEPLVDFAHETMNTSRDYSFSGSIKANSSLASPLKLTLKLSKATTNLDIVITDSQSRNPHLLASETNFTNSRYSDYLSQTTNATRLNRHQNPSQYMIRSHS